MKKGLREIVDAEEIVKSAGMCSRPDYYNGRGAITADLNYLILEKIYQKVKELHGNNAANQYAQMVVDMPKLSATSFLSTFYELAKNKWVWNKRLISAELGINIQPKVKREGKTKRTQRELMNKVVFLHIFSGLTYRDQTDYIRAEFLQQHEKEVVIPESKRQYVGLFEIIENEE